MWLPGCETMLGGVQEFMAGRNSYGRSRLNVTYTQLNGTTFGQVPTTLYGHYSVNPKDLNVSN